jgi:hypothetical protein
VLQSGVNRRGTLPDLLLQSLSPISWFAMPVRYREHDNFLVENAIHDTEGKPMENVPAATGKICWPAVRSFRDSRYRPLKFAFEI